MRLLLSNTAAPNMFFFFAFYIFYIFFVLSKQNVIAATLSHLSHHAHKGPESEHLQRDAHQILRRTTQSERVNTNRKKKIQP